MSRGRRGVQVMYELIMEMSVIVEMGQSMSAAQVQRHEEWRYVEGAKGKDCDTVMGNGGKE